MVVFVQDGLFKVASSNQQGWTHIVLNYIGPNEFEGIRMFINGQEVEGTATKSGEPNSPGDGRIVVGRSYTDHDYYYGSMQVDEVIYFNKALSRDQISDLHLSV